MRASALGLALAPAPAMFPAPLLPAAWAVLVQHNRQLRAISGALAFGGAPKNTKAFLALARPSRPTHSEKALREERESELSDLT